MKKLFGFLAVLAVMLISGLSHAQNPQYSLTARNFNFSAPDSLTFEIYLRHTNQGTVNQFQFSLGQYFFTFNNSIANGGTLTYRIIGTELPTIMQPRNPTVSGSELRLAGNQTPGAGNGFIVPSAGNGVLVVRMSLRTSAASFAQGQQLNLAWKNAAPGFYTRIYAYVGTVNTEITTPASHSIIVSIKQISSVVPEKYEIYQNYPNPFNPSTSIRFDMPAGSVTKLTVFDIAGREVAGLFNGKLQAGSYEYKWNASNNPSGVYFYRLEAGEYSKTMKMILLK